MEAVAPAASAAAVAMLARVMKDVLTSVFTGDATPQRRVTLLLSADQRCTAPYLLLEHLDLLPASTRGAVQV